MTWIVAAEPLDTGERIVFVSERQQALAGRQVVRKARVLGQDGPRAGEIARAAVAEPPAARAHVPQLREPELGLRAPDEAPIRVGRPGDRSGIDELPTVAAQRVEVAALVGVDVDREDEPLVGP